MEVAVMQTVDAEVAVKEIGDVEEEEETTEIVDNRSTSTSFLYSCLFNCFCLFRFTKIKRHILLQFICYETYISAYA